MPGTIKKRYKLGKGTSPFDQTMGRYLHITNIGEIFVCLGVELVAKKLLNITAAELGWR